MFSEISLIYEAGNSATNQGSFVHTLRVYHVQQDCPLGMVLAVLAWNFQIKCSCNYFNSVLGQGIYIENNFNFGDQNNFRDLDMFMRFESQLKNVHNQWYSDSSGLSMQKRLPATNISLEGNTFPITR